MTTSKAPPAPSLAPEGLDERLTQSIHAVIVRYCGAAAAMKSGFVAGLADVARSYAEATRSQALADVASSVGELVTLARAYTGAKGPAAKRGTAP